MGVYRGSGRNLLQFGSGAEFHPQGGQNSGCVHPCGQTYLGGRGAYQCSLPGGPDSLSCQKRPVWIVQIWWEFSLGGGIFRPTVMPSTAYKWRSFVCFIISFWGQLRLQTPTTWSKFGIASPQNPYRGSAPGLHWETSVPQIPEPSNPPMPLSKFASLASEG